MKSILFFLTVFLSIPKYLGCAVDYCLVQTQYHAVRARNRKKKKKGYICPMKILEESCVERCGCLPVA